MNKELAKTLTLALVNYIDENRSEGTMDCSNGECVSLEKAFTEENFDSVETLIKKKLPMLTEFEIAVKNFLHYGLENATDRTVKRIASELLYIAKKQLLSYPDESNPAIEAMADLERAVTCGNVDNIPKWLQEELNKAFKKGQESSHEDHLRGYTNGYKDAEKKYNESVAYHYPTMPQRPLCWEPGGACTNPQMDCINCPRKTTGGGFSTSSGTSTATLHGNTSATDGKEHNPSFTD